MYVAVKGGGAAVLPMPATCFARARRGDSAVPELSCGQITPAGGRLAVAVMAEGWLYDEELAALALKQAAATWSKRCSCCGPSAPPCRVSVIRSRSTPPPCGCAAGVRHLEDVPGGGVLSPRRDYAQRLLDLAWGGAGSLPPCRILDIWLDDTLPPVLDVLAAEGLIEPELPAPVIRLRPT